MKRYKRSAKERWHSWRGIYRRAIGRLRMVPASELPEGARVQWTPISISSPLLCRAYARMGRLYRKAHRKIVVL